MADKRRKASENSEYVKVTLTIDKRLLQKIDVYADEHYMSRSGMISYSCNQILIAEETKKLLGDMNKTLQTMFQAINANPDCGISEEEVKELEQMEFTLNMLSGEYLKKNSDLL